MARRNKVGSTGIRWFYKAPKLIEYIQRNGGQLELGEIVKGRDMGWSHDHVQRDVFLYKNGVRGKIGELHSYRDARSLAYEGKVPGGVDIRSSRKKYSRSNSRDPNIDDIALIYNFKKMERTDGWDIPFP